MGPVARLAVCSIEHTCMFCCCRRPQHACRLCPLCCQCLPRYWGRGWCVLEGWEGAAAPGEACDRYCRIFNAVRICGANQGSALRGALRCVRHCCSTLLRMV